MSELNIRNANKGAVVHAWVSELDVFVSTGDTPVTFSDRQKDLENWRAPTHYGPISLTLERRAAAGAISGSYGSSVGWLRFMGG